MSARARTAAPTARRRSALSRSSRTPPTKPRCAISIDVDALDCYYRIHALGEPPRGLTDVIIRRALPRFAEILRRWGMPATFFLVGRDLDLDGPAARAPARALGSSDGALIDAAEARDNVATARALVAELVAAGHELGNHSYSHPYELARLGPSRTNAEIERAHDLLSDLAGQPVRGFRAPGYDLSAHTLATLERLRYRYDSSIFPAPGYYAAKAAVMAALRLSGRPSGAVLTEPRALLAPPTPYRPDVRRPWRRGGSTLVELPIAVTPQSRLPAIGTSLLLAPAPLREHILSAMRAQPLFNFELHGIDLIDADIDQIPLELVAKQPDLKLSLAHKQDRLESILAYLGRHFEIGTLGDAADTFAPLC